VSAAANRTGSTIAAATIAAWLGGGVACVDSSRPQTADGSGGGMEGAAVDAGPPCEVAPPVPSPDAAPIPSEDTAAPGPYAWKNVVIKGGGFVSGIVGSPALPDLMFAPTDVGGAYRFDPVGKRWMAITDWAGHDDSNLTGIESIAADPVDPSRVYMAAGQYLSSGNGWILSSTDMGQTWTRSAITAPMGGNADGRSMGERLAVDPNLTSVLYFGSRNAGLWKSTDAAHTWSQVVAFPTTGAVNGDAGTVGYGLTFVVFDARSGAPGSATPTIYVGVGVTGDSALYRTTDAGATWEVVSGQPAGLMPHHAVPDRCGNLYLTYNDGPGPNNIKNGAVWRHNIDSGVWTQVSPPHLGGGFGGIAADAAHPGTLVVTTIDYWSPGEIFRTTNGGATWSAMFSAARRDVAGATWLYWHGSNLPAAGWMGDVEIDPFDPDRAFYITGQGLWSSGDVTAADTGAATHWSFADDGLEETVVLDLASPPAGAPLLSGVGDIAGFRHDKLDVSPPDGMFSNPVFGNTTSLDFAESVPDVVARVGTNSSSGGARGAYSTNGGTTWTPFPTAPAGSTGSGSIAVSADGKTFLWAPAKGTPSIASLQGSSLTAWTACGGLPAGAQVASDRVNASKLYGNAGGRMYVSTDGGATFKQGTTTVSGRPRPVFGIEGEVWVATSTGLLRSQDSAATFAPMPQVGGSTAVGFGMPAPGATYPVVYVAGSVAGTTGASSSWGTYRSDDAGATWQRIDDPQHQFGYIRVLAGDPRQYGRVYLGTSGRGILYGDPR